MTAPLDLAVILPTMNEAANVRAVVERLDAMLAGLNWEAIFVDDNSRDGTSDVLRELGLTDRRVRVIQRIGRRGLASACIEGMLATAAPVVAVMDADLQHDAALLPQMLAALREGTCDIAIGSRFVPGGSIGEWDEKRAGQSALATRLAKKLTGADLADPMSGFFMLPAATFRELAPRLSGIGFKILLDILAAAPQPLRIRELPYRFATRQEGESKLDRVIVFEYLVGLYERMFGRIIPTRFALFGTIGALGVLVHMGALAAFYGTDMLTFAWAQSLATLVAMTVNFFLNNALTYRDQRLEGAAKLLRGWIGFCLTCSLGALANIAVAVFLKDQGLWWGGAALAGILVGAVWNYALSSKFVWGRY